MIAQTMGDLIWSPSDRPVGKNILVIDDDPVFCGAMEAVGNSLGMVVRGAHTPRSASLLLLRYRFDLAVIDFSLGNITGIQLARLLEKIGAGMPVLIVSDYKLTQRGHWPASVRQFVQKSAGTRAILREAARLTSGGGPSSTRNTV